MPFDSFDNICKLYTASRDVYIYSICCVKRKVCAFHGLLFGKHDPFASGEKHTSKNAHKTSQQKKAASETFTAALYKNTSHLIWQTCHILRLLHTEMNVY